MTGLKRKNPRLKVLISVGGGREEGSHRFSNLISNAVRRRDFIRSATSFIRQHNFDGLDLHWQYPGAEELGGHSTDKQYFALFLEELSEVFKANDWLLTVSAPASRFRIEDGFDPLRLANTVDFINMQAYDFHSDREPVADHHAPLNSRPHDNDINIFYNVVSIVGNSLGRHNTMVFLFLGICRKVLVEKRFAKIEISCRYTFLR